MTPAEMKKLGYRELDVLLISGDAYVDHPSYGTALIGRLLQSHGFKVGIIAQPRWDSIEDFLRLGKPGLFAGITAGNVDSMIAHYTANKRKRKADDYSPGGKSGLRPDRASIVYANRAREAFGKTPLILGGIEASMRRFAHYDYWEDKVRRSLLLDAKADLLVYGMGEQQILEAAKRLSKNPDPSVLQGIRGTVSVTSSLQDIHNIQELPSFEEVEKNKQAFNKAFTLITRHMNPFKGKTLIQAHAGRFVVQYPPPLPPSQKVLDSYYELPFLREAHPSYAASGGIKGFETVRFSLIAHRGCAGECSFCSLSLHQGRMIQSRSEASILKEASLLTQNRNFKGTITDVGGPTSNLYASFCPLWEKQGPCENRKCLVPRKCSNLKLGNRQCLELYQKLSRLPKVNHVFIGSGFRHDLLACPESREYFEKICKSHISGQIKVAPEHISERVLKLMNKPVPKVYEEFLDLFQKAKQKSVHKLYPVNYFIASHPGASLKEALELGLYLAKNRIHAEQVQDFIPLPMTASGCMYYTGENPLTGEEVYVPRTMRERRIQRAFIQYFVPENKSLLMEGLKELNALNLLSVFLKAGVSSGKKHSVCDEE